MPGDTGDFRARSGYGLYPLSRPVRTSSVYFM
jgi:hypothetical protein